MEVEKKRISIPGWALVLVMALYGEVILNVWTNHPIVWGRLLSVTALALGSGSLLALLVSLVPGRGQKWLAVVISFVLAVMDLTWYFINESFKIFMTIDTILSGAEGVATGFLDTVLGLLARDWWRIVLMLLPILLYALFARSKSSGWKSRGVLAGVTLAGYVLAFCSVQFVTGDMVVIRDAYNFDSAVHDFGLHAALLLDMQKSGTTDSAPAFQTVETPTLAPEAETEARTDAQDDPVAETEAVVYEPNVLDIDFDKLAQEQSHPVIKSLHQYVAAQTPSLKNEYTGLLKGKNLILISAEAFSREVIDKDRTPTLYRMAHEGIEFTDYYQPNWGGGTAGGEFANIAGFPGSGGVLFEAPQQNLFLTMGHQLQRLGYRSGAYHNNDHNFYQRSQTHVYFGYDEFMGVGSGMEEGVQGIWPESDLEMFQFIMPRYLESSDPFSLYFMTVSGHSVYYLDRNAMAQKNYDVVKDLPYSDEVLCYLAGNQEVENAMAYLLQALEETGHMDDTVVVISPDHYPYGLEKSATWGNSTDHLTQLYGYPSDNDMHRDHNALIIWSGCLEGMDLQIDAPTSSLDILPTLSNLFGLDYDSRLLPGRDVFSEAEPIVLWNTFSWKTDKGYYNSPDRSFHPNEGVTVDEGYVDRINTIVRNKLTYSKSVKDINYFNYVPQPEAPQS